MRAEVVAAMTTDESYAFSGRQAECVVNQLVERQGEGFLRQLPEVLDDEDFVAAAQATLDVCG